MKVLLSIKPEFAEKIFNGTKKFEFRKAIFKNKKIKTVVVYASAPVQRVIGEFEIEGILTGTPDRLWENTCHAAGIDEDYFRKYFLNRELGFAIQIRKVKRYPVPLKLQEAFQVTPPQSFLYLEK